MPTQMQIVYCNNDTCKFNADGTCQRTSIVVSSDATCLSKEQGEQQDEN